MISKIKTSGGNCLCVEREGCFIPDATNGMLSPPSQIRRGCSLLTIRGSESTINSAEDPLQSIFSHPSSKSGRTRRDRPAHHSSKSHRAALSTLDLKCKLLSKGFDNWMLFKCLFFPISKVDFFFWTENVGQSLPPVLLPYCTHDVFAGVSSFKVGLAVQRL